MLTYNPDSYIVFPESCRRVMLDQSRRAIDAYKEGKIEKGKAFGLVFGSADGQVLEVARCFPLERNVRSQSPYKEYMDRMMEEHAIPSVTPMELRGWVADPAELFARIKECRKDGLELVGTYHMHRVGWKHDSRRDTPTVLDKVLAKESGLVMFIISMVDPDQPIIRAFYEGVLERELPIKG